MLTTCAGILMKLLLQTCEERDLLAATLLGSALTVNLAGAKVNTVDVSVVADDVVVNENGQLSTFARSQVDSLVLNGNLRTRNVMQNRTDIDAVMIGGNMADVIYAGSGTNTINPGRGNDVVSALEGVNTIDVAAQGVDRVFTNATATVTSTKAKDTVVQFGATGREQGSGFIGVVGGTLFISPFNTQGVVGIANGKKAGEVTVRYVPDQTLDPQANILTFKKVKFIAYLGGTEPNIYVNQTRVSEAVIGGAQGDYLRGGIGTVSFISGGAGNDTIFTSGKNNVVNGGVGANSFFLGVSMDAVIANSFDTIHGRRKNDGVVLV
jgi:Ca2+-binding RTX toxin-like protein